MKSIREILPRASQDCIDLNPLSSPSEPIKTSSTASVATPRRGRMNKTEAEYAMILESMKRKGRISRYDYEGMTLKWADMKYTPDFVAIDSDMADGLSVKIIEVKGGHIWDRDIVRFKGARAYWPEFQFEMWQKKKGQWTQLLLRDESR